MKKPFLWILLFSINYIQAQDLNTFFKSSDTFFKTHIRQGKVNYEGIKKDMQSLDDLVGMIKNASVSDSNPNIYKAFYINAYNILVIKGILNNYPVDSPLSIGGFFDKIKYNVAGKSITLNTLEKKLLLKKYKDPRFHFVLVCAGLGCPPIIPNAYLPQTLEKQLNKQTKLSLNNPKFTIVKKKHILLSELFKWYKSDFTQSGSEIDFINIYRTEKVPKSLKVKYYPYNWKLNKTN